VRSEPQETLDPRAITVWRVQALLRTALIGLFAALSLTGVILMSPAGPFVLAALGAGVLAYGTFGVFVAPPIRFRIWRYALSEHELELKRGLLVVRRTLIPLVRVQHVDTRQGPLLKLFGLSAVTVSTAASTHEIPVLADELAELLRDRISALARQARDNI
jgi:uncharacterized protein